MTPLGKLCVVCVTRPRDGSAFCTPCRRSYDRTVATNDDESTLAVIRWAADRARLALRAKLRDRVPNPETTRTGPRYLREDGR